MITADEARQLSKIPTSEMGSVFDLYCSQVKDAAEKKQNMVRLNVAARHKDEIVQKFGEQGFDVEILDHEIIVRW